jgi:hypothetical protein
MEHTNYGDIISNVSLIVHVHGQGYGLGSSG